MLIQPSLSKAIDGGRSGREHRGKHPPERLKRALRSAPCARMAGSADAAQQEMLRLYYEEDFAGEIAEQFGSAGKRARAFDHPARCKAAPLRGGTGGHRASSIGLCS